MDIQNLRDICVRYRDVLKRKDSVDLVFTNKMRGDKVVEEESMEPAFFYPWKRVRSDRVRLREFDLAEDEAPFYFGDIGALTNLIIEIAKDRQSSAAFRRYVEDHDPPRRHIVFLEMLKDDVDNTRVFLERGHLFSPHDSSDVVRVAFDDPEHFVGDVRNGVVFDGS